MISVCILYSRRRRGRGQQTYKHIDAITRIIGLQKLAVRRERQIEHHHDGAIRGLVRSQSIDVADGVNHL